VNNTIWSE